MKLPKIRRLMGLLARDMQRTQVKELLAALPPFYVSQKEREECETAIRFFVLLKKRTGTDKAFLDKLENLLADCKCEDFLETIRKFKSENPDFLSESSSSEMSLPNGTRAGFKPKPGQSEKFRSILLSISRTLAKKQLEIMVALPPTPEASKQSIIEGHELFDHMERHGCISENDTEMLQEMLGLFPLKDAIAHLTRYHKQFPPIIHDPEPSAPFFAPVSAGVQPPYGSLPQYANQPQSAFHLSHQSLPIGYGHQPTSSVSYAGPVSFSRQPTSLSSYAGQADSFSAPSSGGSGYYHQSSQESHSAPNPAPFSTPHKESGEDKSNYHDVRVVVPSVSPSTQHRALEGTVKTFPDEMSAPTPPNATPSSSSGINDTYPRPLQRKRHHQEEPVSHGNSRFVGNRSPPSSGVYPRPLHEQERKYPYPSSGVLPGREGKEVPGHQHNPPRQSNIEANVSMPPPSKAPRFISQHSGDGGVFSRLRRQGNGHGEAEGGRQSAQHQREMSTSMSTLSSYTGDSDKFNSTESEMSMANPYPAGGGQASLETLESYRAEHSANIHQVQEQQPPPSAPPPPPPPPPPSSHSLLSYSAESLNVSEGHQVEPSLSLSSSSVSGQPPSTSSSVSPYRGQPRFSTPTHIQPRQSSSSQESSQRSQLRNASGNFIQPARHQGGFAYQYQQQQVGGANQQPFVQQASQPVSSVEHYHMPSEPSTGVSLSSLSNYPGPSTQSFAKSAVAEQGNRRGQQMVYSKPVVPVKRSPVMNKSEATKAYKADQFQSLNHDVETTTKLGQYQEQLSSFSQRHRPTDPQTQRTEQGRKVTQASSERNIATPLQEETRKEGEGEQSSSSSSENGSFQTASGGYPSLYPQLLSNTSSRQQSSSSATTLAGTKRTRGSAEQAESGEVGEEEKEAEPSTVKKLKTSQRVTRSATKKPGILSRFVGYIFGSKDEASSEEPGNGSSSEEQVEVKSENTESESEFHDAQEY